MSANTRSLPAKRMAKWTALISAGILVPALFLPAGAASAASKEVNVELVDIAVKPKAITVAAGTDLTLKVKNTGAAVHNIQVNGGKTGSGDLKNGASKAVKLGKVTKSLKLWCTIAGHKEAGMTFDVNVSGSAPAASSGGSGASAASPGDQKLDPAAKWPKGFKSDDPTLKPADAATTHDVTFHMTNKIVEVAPGVKQEMWTFGDQVPGPTLHGKVGDTFNVTIINDTKMTHNIDFHASQTSMDVDMGPVAPGASLTYSFKAEYSGIWMYHCGTAPALHHIGNGMAGAVVIDPPGLAPVQHEWALVQSD
ncbi:MAG: multicopper oxidase domain-containing protein, partial [Acidimicrobiia bacterium]